MSSLESLSSTALRKAERLGANQVEVFIIRTHSRSVYVENSKPRVSDDKSETGLGIKLCLGKHIGFASGTVGKASVDEIVNDALSIARTTEEDPNFKSLPIGGKFSGRVSGVYSEETSRMGLEEITKMAMETVKVAEKTRSVKVPLGLIRLADYSLHVGNSLGVNFGHKGTMVFSYFKSKATIGDRAGEGIEKEWSTNISNIDFEKMGSSVAERALATLKAESFKEERNVTSVIVPVELGGTLGLAGLLYTVQFATNSEQVNKKRSPWVNKLGETVASEKLTIWDDGRYTGGIRSALADDEGVETSRKAIIERGKLQSYIYDSYNAGIAGVKATGNGFRRGTMSIEGAFTIPTACSYANMVVNPGNKSIDNIVSRIDKGILVDAFAAPEVNNVTGGFGCEVRDATLIEDGQLTKHVKHALLTGNMYEGLKEIFDIGEETKIVENMVLPSIAFSNFTLVGQK